MATVAPETAETPSDAGISEASSAMTMALPAGMVPMETGKRTGREPLRMPNQEATIPAAWMALGDGCERKTMGTAGCGIYAGVVERKRKQAEIVGQGQIASRRVRWCEFASMRAHRVELEGSSQCSA